jgi:hypothetical protein
MSTETYSLDRLSLNWSTKRIHLYYVERASANSAERCHGLSTVSIQANVSKKHRKEIFFTITRYKEAQYVQATPTRANKRTFGMIRHEAIPRDEAHSCRTNSSAVALAPEHPLTSFTIVNLNGCLSLIAV